MMFEDYVTAIPSISPVFSFVLLNVMIGIIAFASKLANQTKHTITQQEHSQNHQNHSHNHHHHQQQQQQQYHHQQQQQQQQFQQNKQNWLARSPSIILERVRSINFSSYRSQEQNSATNFNLEHTQEHENSSQYIFEQPHQENEHVSSNTPSNNSHQNHQETTTEPQLHVQSNFEHTQEKKTQKIDAFSPKTDEFELNHENAEHLEEEQEEEEEQDDDELQSLDELHTNTAAGINIMRTKSDAEPSSGEALPKLARKMRKSASMQSPFMHFEAEDIVEEIRRPETMREMENGVDEKADDFINMFRNQLKLQRMDSIIRYKEMITRGSEK